MQQLVCGLDDPRRRLEIENFIRWHREELGADNYDGAVLRQWAR